MNQCLKYQNIKFSIMALVCIFLVCFTIENNTCFAIENKDTIRVGFFSLPGFNEYDELGNPTGYNIEYLNYVADHTGWNYEFVKANSWQEALYLLENGEIDLLSPSQWTLDRSKKFAFTEYPFGTEYGSILTLDTNYDMTYEDFEGFSDLKFGCVQTLIFKDAFFEYAKLHGFTPNLTYYKDTNALMSALKVGEVDAVVANLMNAKENMKVLAKFAPGSFYYILNKENTDLLQTMNETMAHIKVTHSEIEPKLTEKYYPFYYKVAFTKQEMDYVEMAPEFTIGCISNREPISYFDPVTGEFAGITRDILDKVSEISGLKFKYVSLPTGAIKYDYFTEHNIQLISSVEHNYINLTTPGLNLTNPYLSSRKIVVGKRELLQKETFSTIALSTGSQTLTKVMESRYPNAEILIFETIEECFEAVLAGEAEVLIQNQYAVERYLPKPKYEDLTVLPSEGIEDELALASVIYQEENGVEEEVLSDNRLIKIINKSIANINKNEIAEIIIHHTTNQPYKFTIADSSYRYRYFIIALTIVTILGTFLAIYSLRLKSKNAAILKQNEAKLRSITNNINGGVVVLLPNKGLKISYANEGFLSLIQYSKDEYEALRSNNYVTYIHPEDIESLNTVIDDNFDGNDHLSIRLRLLRKDGTYLPTLFNGTLAVSSEKQKELYCVIMDLSEQIKIMEELEQEQVRYQLLLEKSDDMIFDINLELKEITISNKFFKKFGWTLPAKYEEASVEQILSIWHIHHEDADVFKESVSNLLNLSIDTECKARIWKSDSTYRWCNISHNIMKKNGKVVRLIGKVVDIDEEIKEKERLLYKAQVDTLTGHYNKEAFYKLCTKYFKENHNAAILFIDLDNFKQVNDLLGHMTGDKAIKDAAKKLKMIFSQHDLISRFGGDEFCILVKEIAEETLIDKLNWIIDKLNEIYQNEQQTVTITASIGVVLAPDFGTDISHLLLCADQALYSAKECGKNQFVVYNEGLELNGYKGRK